MDTLKLNMALIAPPRLDVRNENEDDDIESLAKSLHDVGLIEPIVVIAVNEGYEIVAGHRRFQAAYRLRWNTIDARILNEKDSDPMLVKIHENIHRKNITPLEEAQIVGYLHYEKGAEIRDVISMLGKSASWVSDRLDMLAWPDDIKALLHMEGVKLGVVRELMQIPDETVRKTLIDNAVRGGITIATARQWRADYMNVVVPPTDEAALLASVGILPEPISCDIECFLCSQKSPVGHTHAPNLCGRCYSDVLREKAEAQRSRE